MKTLLKSVLLLALSLSISAQDWSLKFDGNKAQHIKVGPFYTPNADYSNSPFFVEAWIKPGALPNARYWIAQGYGGEHILLVGVNHAETGRVYIEGNFNFGTNYNAYQSADSTPVGEWAHHAVLYVPANYFLPGNPATPTVYTFINGVLSSQTTVVNARANSGNYSFGSNTLEIGGTDHSNFDGSIAQVRLFEGSVPFIFDQSVGQQGASSFVPERSFRGGIYTPNDVTKAKVSLLYDLRNKTGSTIPDLGVGFNGGTHSGVLASGFHSFGQFGEPDNYDTDLPTWVQDPVMYRKIVEPSNVPSNAILYDSFTRDDVTPVTQGSMNLGLGNLEKGGTWQGASAAYGILNHRAFGVAAGIYPVYADVASPNMDVRASTGDANVLTVPTIYARYTNNGDNLNMYYYEGLLRIQEVSGGSAIQSAAVPYPGGDLRINVSRGVARFYAGDTLVQTFNNVTRTGTKAGFFISGMQRVDTFEVYSTGKQ